MDLLPNPKLHFTVPFPFISIYTFAISNDSPHWLKREAISERKKAIPSIPITEILTKRSITVD